MSAQMTEFFPFGCQYHRAPTPLPEEWDGDMAEIARQGYTHIQFRPQWRRHERLRGQFVWDDLDRLFELAQRHRLRVILKAQLENAPDWVFTELDGARVGFHGKKLEPMAHAAFYVGGWWPCFDNPAVAAAAEHFTQVLAERYKDHPALWFYNAWNEPRSRPLGQCLCEHSVAAYRAWLREKFGTVEELNRRYGKEWGGFDTVRPPYSHSDYVELFLWRQWAADAVAKQVAAAVRGFRAADPGRAVMCHVGCSSLVQDPACDTSNDLLNAAQVDWYGCSFPIELYPRTVPEHNQPLFQSAWLRRVDPGYWCQEFYTNYANWCREPDAAFIEQAVWMAIASGCRGLTFWQYKSERFGEESNGWGMRNIDGSPTPRSESCDRVAKALRSLGDDFAATSVPRSGAAILFDIPNDLLQRIESMSSDLCGIDSICARTDYPSKNALAGSHTVLRELGCGADFVTFGDDLAGYRLLAVNSVEMVDEAQAAWLTQFVEAGGTLLVEYPFACRDERTWVLPHRPGHGLEGLTGCREGHRLALAEKTTEMVELEGGSRQAVAGCRVELLPENPAEVIGRWSDGGAAVVRHAAGRGQVIVCGGNFALAAFDGAGVPEVYRLAMRLAGLATSEGAVWSCVRRSEKSEYCFRFNAGDRTAEYRPEAGERLCYASPGSGEGRIAPAGTVIACVKR